MWTAEDEEDYEWDLFEDDLMKDNKNSSNNAGCGCCLFPFLGMIGIFGVVIGVLSLIL